MDRRHPGVRALTDQSIQIDFTYQGVRCRETLKVKPTQAALKEAARKRDAVLYEISHGSFDYSKHFPNSRRAKRFSKYQGHLITIEEALSAWIKRNQKRLARSTLKDYLSAVNYHLIPEFGHLALDQLSPGDVKEWMAELPISAKRINNILTPLRQTYEDAFYDEVIEKNPMQRVKNLSTTRREPQPFNSDEISRILSQLDSQARNLIQFAFGSGLRTSELIALRWDDVDLSQGVVHVRRAEVLGNEKTTKTTSGLRTVDVMPLAVEALEQQAQLTGKATDRVFLDPKTGKPWKDNHIIRNRIWTPALRKAGVEYRNPYQTRHTFASTLLSQGKNPLWVAQQMGHKDWGMIRSTYGRWIRQ